MTSADLIVSSLSEIKNNEKLDHYDSDLCADIHSKIDSSLRSNGYSLADREKFVSSLVLFLSRSAFHFST